MNRRKHLIGTHTLDFWEGGIIMVKHWNKPFQIENRKREDLFLMELTKGQWIKRWYLLWTDGDRIHTIIANQLKVLELFFSSIAWKQLIHYPFTLLWNWIELWRKAKSQLTRTEQHYCASLSKGNAPEKCKHFEF